MKELKQPLPTRRRFIAGAISFFAAAISLPGLSIAAEDDDTEGEDAEDKDTEKKDAKKKPAKKKVAKKKAAKKKTGKKSSESD